MPEVDSESTAPRVTMDYAFLQEDFTKEAEDFEKDIDSCKVSRQDVKRGQGASERL